MTAPVNIALAGISGYGDSYLEALLHNDRSAGAKLVGVVDPMPQRCRRLAELQARGIPVHSTMQNLFAQSQVELMLIATPIHLHASQSCLALSRGINVLCEKPLAGTLTDAFRMYDCQKAATAFCAIGFQWSFSQAVQSLKKDIITGALGRPVRMRSLVYFPRNKAYSRRNDWAGRVHTPGGDDVFDSPVNNATAHYLHNMFYLLGRTRETSAMLASVQAELYRGNDIENYDTAALRCVTTDGVECLFYTTHIGPDRIGPRSIFEFERATVEFDVNDASQFVARFHHGPIKAYGNPNLDRHEKIWQCIDAVRSDRSIACGVEAALPHALCVAAAQESGRDIVPFPQHLRREVPLDGSTMIVVDNLQQDLLTCYERAVLPSELGTLSWARASAPVTLGQPDFSTRTQPRVAALQA